MRIFVPQGGGSPLAAGELTIRGDEHHYLTRVRRAVAGDTIELLDGEGLRAPAEILKIGESETVVRVGSVEQIADKAPRIRALVPLIKGDRMDTCLEKLVETGVDDIVVFPAARSVVKLDNERRPARLEHFQATAQAAARQSGRASVPSVTWADTLGAAISKLPGGALLVLDPAADRADLRTLLARTGLPFASPGASGAQHRSPGGARSSAEGGAEFIDRGDARAFDESTDVAVTGRYQRPDLSQPATEHPRDPDDVTSTGRFVRTGASSPPAGSSVSGEWPLEPDRSASFVDHVTLVTGPEGGLAPTELDALVAAGFTALGLGPRVLRAETAPAIAVALIRSITES